MPWVEAVETKQSFAYTRIISKHPKAVVKEIYDGVTKAVKQINKMKRFTLQEPVEVEIRYRRLDAAKHAKNIDMNGNHFAFKDGYTRVGRLKKLEDILNIF